uniref:Peptide/nickel transport system substrate-binding protein n=1 Tax=Acetithermum autotrophicum TaxID=1446466 RepID=H5SRT1_ACEAU|nr:peptide/nickel transport system substrate-binding protein [Candidatus Acetothermum autotrophicum]
MRKLLFTVVCLMLVAVTATLAGPEKNNLIIGTNQEPDQLNPWEGAADTKENVMALFYIGLTYFDNQGNLQPGLATEVPTEKNGRVRIVRDAQGKFVRQEVDWTIRTNAKWSDGIDITTDDVLFTLEVQRNELIPVTFRTFSNIIQEIRVRDNKNFTIVYKEPNLFFASPTGRVGLARFYDIAPKHIWEPIFRDAIREAQANPGRAAEIIQQKFLGADPATGKDPAKVVGSGPFKFAEWQRNQFIRFTRRPDFFLPPPGDPKNYVQEVTVRFFTATETLLSAILAGEIDASDDIGLAGQDPAVLRGQLGDRGVVEVSPSGFIEQLNFNNFVRGRKYAGKDVDLPVCQTADDLLLGDKRTRQAIIQALDRDAIRVVFPGAILSNSFVVRGDLGFNEKLNPWPRNVENAKKLLAELGWKPGPGGVLTRKTADGRDVFFRLPHVTTPATFRVRTQEILQRQLRDVGIVLEVSNQPASVLFSTEFVSGSNCNWQGIIEFASAGGIGEVPADELSGELWADDPDTPAPFDNIPRAANGFAGSNITGWANADYDKLHFQALSQIDAGARAETIKKLQEIFSDELPFIPLYERVEILTAKKGLVNYTKGTPLTRTPMWNAWEWGWEQNGAKKVR